MRLIDVNWSDLNSVIRYAKTLKGRHIVIRHADRDNYNIAHYSSLNAKINANASVHYITGTTRRT